MWSVRWDRDKRSGPLVGSSMDDDAHSLAHLLGGILGQSPKIRTASTKQVFTTKHVSACERALLSVIMDFSDTQFISEIMAVINTDGQATKDVKDVMKMAQMQVVALGGDGANSTKVMYIVLRPIACREYQFAPKYMRLRWLLHRHISGRGKELLAKEWANIHRITNLIDVVLQVNPPRHKTAIFFACTYLGDGNYHTTAVRWTPRASVSTPMS